jgi:hypothetical protein
LGVALALAAACARQPASASKTVGSQRFEISVPSGWTCETTSTSRAGDGAPLPNPEVAGVSCAGPAGERLSVSDEAYGVGGIWDADAWIDVAVTATGRLEVKGTPALCDAPGEGQNGANCLRGDGRLEAIAYVQSPAGTFIVVCGNTRREDAEDLKGCLPILRTFRVK